MEAEFLHYRRPALGNDHVTLADALAVSCVHRHFSYGSCFILAVIDGVVRGIGKAGDGGVTGLCGRVDAMDDGSFVGLLDL